MYWFYRTGYTIIQEVLIRPCWVHSTSMGVDLELCGTLKRQWFYCIALDATGPYQPRQKDSETVSSQKLWLHWMAILNHKRSDTWVFLCNSYTLVQFLTFSYFSRIVWDLWCSPFWLSALTVHIGESYVLQTSDGIDSPVQKVVTHSDQLLRTSEGIGSLVRR